jgi:prepilin-type N-terminal cleavage/methylation domain-containing protein/prepilin-type processing-associated H-X9-DG protein
MPDKPKRGFTLIELLVVIAIIAILAALLFPVFARAKESAQLRQCASNSKQMGVAIEMYIGDYDNAYPMNRLPDSSHRFGFDWGALHGSCRDWRRAISTYLRSREAQVCPNNKATWIPGYGSYPGLESNHCIGKNTDSPSSHPDWLPNSYAYNGAWFHESVYQWYLSPRSKPTQQALKTSMLRSPAELIYILETRMSPPDLGDWMMVYTCDFPGSVSGWSSCFQVHSGGRMNWVFADTHAKTLTFARTISPKEYWTDTPMYQGQDAQVFMENEYKSAVGELKQ